MNQLRPERTHEGAQAVRIGPLAQLERSVMSCLLWESEFYEDGRTIALRIADLVKAVPASDAVGVAVRAKEEMRLRHAPLLLVRELMRSPEGRALAKDVFPRVITRPDDIAEFLALYWKDNKDEPLAKQVKRHLGDSFRKFNEYQLAKHNGGRKAVKLRDAIRILRPKPADDAQAELWRKLVKDELATPDTWEVELSAGNDKKATFERLMTERKLGALAFVRNLRNMHQVGIAKRTVASYARTARIDRPLPFQFIAAAKAVPAWEDIVEEMMLRCLEGQPKLPGKTILIVDASGSMSARLSSKSEMRRLDVAASLAILARELCEEPVIYCTAGDDFRRKHATMRIPPQRGFALAECIAGEETGRKIGGGGIFLVQCLKQVRKEQRSADRIIVLTDEQDCDIKLKPESADAFGERNYLINVASARNGIGYGKWVHIDGWSDKVLDYIVRHEAAQHPSQRD